jgi:uncharacterized membrane protein YuzA (DUF378 family)
VKAIIPSLIGVVAFLIARQIFGEDSWVVSLPVILILGLAVLVVIIFLAKRNMAKAADKQDDENNV